MKTVITGASSGIGQACARLLAKAGHELVLIARRAERLETLANELGSKTKVFIVDVSDSNAVETWAKSQAELLNDIDVLINNAGLAQGLSAFQDSQPSEWDVMIDTNVKGLLYVTHAILPAMIKRKSGHIVNLGSVAGHHVYPKGHVYCATKHAVRALTEAMRIDLNGTGVRVTEVSPGMVETEFSVVRLGDEAKAKAVYSGMTPLTADDIAETIAWCLSRPKHVNIQELVIYPTDQASPTIVHRKN